MKTALARCPICGKVPGVEYACGSYFAYCSDDCDSPMCEHLSKSSVVLSWNDWAHWYRMYLADHIGTDAIEALRVQQEAAKNKPQVQGEWVDRGGYHTCSECCADALCDGCEEEVLSSFCPSCGAKMNEED